MIAIFIYNIVNFQHIKYNDRYTYPTAAYILGWTITFICLIQFPIFAFITIIKQKEKSFVEKFKMAFRPATSWGPKDSIRKQEYLNFIESRS